MGKINILVVEDEPFIGLGIRQKIEKLGYHVIMVVASGDEAYQVSSERVPDLILMDIRLEGNLDGIQTAKTLWENFSVPIVFVTGNVQLVTSIQPLKDWCYGIVEKPFQGIELETSVASAINRIFYERYSAGEKNLLDENSILHPIQEWVDRFPEHSSHFPNPKFMVQEPHRKEPLDLFQLLIRRNREIGDDESVDMQEYLSQVAFLVWNRIQGKVPKFGNPELLLDIESIHLSENQALPLAVILSEALSNALEYGFSQSESKAIVQVRFGMNRQKDRYCLEVRDNGKGFSGDPHTRIQYPENRDHSMNPDKGYGLKIIQAMSSMLGGEFYLNGDHGTTLELRLPLSVPV